MQFGTRRMNFSRRREGPLEVSKGGTRKGGQCRPTSRLDGVTPNFFSTRRHGRGTALRPQTKPSSLEITAVKKRRQNVGCFDEADRTRQKKSSQSTCRQPTCPRTREHKTEGDEEEKS